MNIIDCICSDITAQHAFERAYLRPSLRNVHVQDGINYFANDEYAGDFLLPLS